MTGVVSKADGEFHRNLSIRGFKLHLDRHAGWIWNRVAGWKHTSSSSCASNFVVDANLVELYKRKIGLTMDGGNGVQMLGRIGTNEDTQGRRKSTEIAGPPVGSLRSTSSPLTALKICSVFLSSPSRSRRLTPVAKWRR